MSQTVICGCRVTDLGLLEKVLKDKGVNYEKGGVVKDYHARDVKVDIYVPEYNVGWVKSADGKGYDAVYAYGSNRKGQAAIHVAYNELEAKIAVAKGGMKVTKRTVGRDGSIQLQVGY